DGHAGEIERFDAGGGGDKVGGRGDGGRGKWSRGGERAGERGRAGRIAVVRGQGGDALIGQRALEGDVDGGAEGDRAVPFVVLVEDGEGSVAEGGIAGAVQGELVIPDSGAG